MLGDLPLAEGEKNVTVPVTTDKGLCGAINTMICKYTRTSMQVANPEGEQQIVILGEKGKSQLQRDQTDKIVATFADTQKVRLTFPQTCSIAEEILKTEFDVARIVYNRFVSAISQKPTIATILSPDALEKQAEAGSSLDAYEIEGPGRAELLQNLAEFNLATSLYTAMLENNCSEQSSRMSAMENSTKNAGEMLGKLTLTYNRTRQASITTELIEIISGATALEDQTFGDILSIWSVSRDIFFTITVLGIYKAIQKTILYTWSNMCQCAQSYPTNAYMHTLTKNQIPLFSSLVVDPDTSTGTMGLSGTTTSV